MTAPERKFPKVITALVVVSVGVNVIVAVAVGLLALYSLTLNQQTARLAAQNAANAGAIHTAQLESCRASNIARGRDIAIWNRLLRITPAQRAAETAAQRAEVTQLEHLVKVKDTPVNCAALYRP